MLVAPRRSALFSSAQAAFIVAGRGGDRVRRLHMVGARGPACACDPPNRRSRPVRVNVHMKYLRARATEAHAHVGRGAAWKTRPFGALAPASARGTHVDARTPRFMGCGAAALLSRVAANLTHLPVNRSGVGRRAASTTAASIATGSRMRKGQIGRAPLAFVLHCGYGLRN